MTLANRLNQLAIQWDNKCVLNTINHSIREPTIINNHHLTIITIDGFLFLRSFSYSFRHSSQVVLLLLSYFLPFRVSLLTRTRKQTCDISMNAVDVFIIGLASTSSLTLKDLCIIVILVVAVFFTNNRFNRREKETDRQITCVRARLCA